MLRLEAENHAPPGGEEQHRKGLGVIPVAGGNAWAPFTKKTNPKRRVDVASPGGEG